jgi:transcription termination factor Rho
VATTDKSALEGKVAAELHQIASDLGIEGHKSLKKAELVEKIIAHDNGAPSTAIATAPGREPRTSNAEQDSGGGSADSGDRPRSETPAGTEGGQRTERGDSAPNGSVNTDDRQQGEDRQRPDRSDRDRRDGRQGGGQGAGRQGGGQGDGRQGGGQGAGRQGDGRQGGGQYQGQNRDRDGGAGRRRPSREERRRQRDERRVREVEVREDELLTAPTATGLLDVLPEGYGFLRTSGYLPGPQDIYVSLSQVRRFMLRKGDTVTGKVREARNNEKYPALLLVESVNGMDPELAADRPSFDKLTPLFPNERFRLESGPLAIAERIVDMVAPIGKGQRGMVVSPPKAGKTTILKQIANGIIHSNPETHVIVLLVDERPEEVTDWQRTVQAAEVVYSTFDKPTDQHIQVTELVLERSKRLAEMGQDVAIILDSLTRLTRAYNLAMPASGKILTGGIDASALYPPRRFFGAARNIEEGGSVTIIASALVETGSRMDEGIFEEFKGTGNMELRLDRQLAEKRLFPAINVDASGTRKEELLLPPEELALVIRLRRVLHALDSGAALELLVDKLRSTKSNELFLKDIAKAPAGN